MRPDKAATLPLAIFSYYSRLQLEIKFYNLWFNLSQLIPKTGSLTRLQPFTATIPARLA